MKSLKLFLIATAAFVSLASSAAEAQPQPEGTPKYYWAENSVIDLADNDSYTSSWGVYAIFGPDNKVYIKGLVDNNISGQNFIEGTLDGNKITVKLPQIYKYYDDDDYSYITLLEKETYYGNEDGEYIEVDEDDNYIVYTIDDEGNITLDLNDDESAERPDYIIADANHLYDSDYYYSGIGFQKFSILSELTGKFPNIVPDDVEMHDYLMIHDLYNDNKSSQNVSLGFGGEKIYIYIETGWYDAVLVGDMVDDKAVFHAPQFVGFYGFAQLEVWDDTAECELNEHVMYYDPETKILTPGDNKEISLIISGYGGELYMGSFYNPVFYPTDAAIFNANPKDPAVRYFTHYGEYGPGISGRINWEIPQENVNGYPIIYKNTYINFYKNGEIVAFDNFDGSCITDIPEGFANRSLFFFEDTLVVDFDYDDYTTFGLQTFYLGSDGVTYASNLVTYDPFTGQHTGIHSANTAKTLVNAECYDLQGRRIANPAAGGIYIMRCTYSDGSTSTTKIAKK